MERESSQLFHVVLPGPYIQRTINNKNPRSLLCGRQEEERTRSYDYLTLVASSSQLFVGHHLENKTSQMYNIDPMHRKGPLITAGHRKGNNAFSSVIQDVHLSGQCGIA